MSQLLLELLIGLKVLLVEAVESSFVSQQLANLVPYLHLIRLFTLLSFHPVQFLNFSFECIFIVSQLFVATLLAAETDLGKASIPEHSVDGGKV